MIARLVSAKAVGWLLVVIGAELLAIALVSKLWLDARDEKAKAETVLQTCKDANESNVDAIGKVRDRLVECLGEPQRVENLAEIVEAELAPRLQAIEQQVRARADTRSKIYASDEACREWSRRPVCSAVDRELRRTDRPD